MGQPDADKEKPTAYAPVRLQCSFRIRLLCILCFVFFHANSDYNRLHDERIRLLGARYDCGDGRNVPSNHRVQWAERIWQFG